MHLPTDRPASPGRLLAASLLALLTACQPSGGERVVAGAAGTTSSAPAASAPATPSPPAVTPTSTPASTTPPPASPPAHPAPVSAPTSGAGANAVSLAIGEERAIAANTRLRLLRVVNDSRCPKDAQCIWAGEVTLEFELGTGRSPARFELSQATKPRANAKGIDFELLGFGSCPSGQGRMADAECASVAISAPAER